MRISFRSSFQIFPDLKWLWHALNHQLLPWFSQCLQLAWLASMHAWTPGIPGIFMWWQMGANGPSWKFNLIYQHLFQREYSQSHLSQYMFKVTNPFQTLESMSSNTRCSRDLPSTYSRLRSQRCEGVLPCFCPKKIQILPTCLHHPKRNKNWHHKIEKNRMTEKKSIKDTLPAWINELFVNIWHYSTKMLNFVSVTELPTFLWLLDLAMPWSVAPSTIMDHTHNSMRLEHLFTQIGIHWVVSSSSPLHAFPPLFGFAPLGTCPTSIATRWSESAAPEPASDGWKTLENGHFLDHLG